MLLAMATEITKVRYPDGNVLLRNLNRDYPLVERGDGLYLFDTTGKRYVDASGGAMVVSLGHGNREIADKIAEQMGRVSYVNGQHFSSRAMENLAAKLSGLAPDGLNRVFILNSGSEAIEAAVKFVRQLWVERKLPERSKFIARSPGYHGNTLYALSLSAREHYKKFFAPLLSEVIMIPSTYEYRSQVENYSADGGRYYATLLEEAIVKNGRDEIAGFIVEPVIGSSAGASLAPPEYFKLVQEICSHYKIPIIADEVLCGAGRVGKFFASDLVGLKPDLIVLGKGLNSGFCPVTAVLVRDEHVREMKAGSGGFMHAQTFLQSPTLAATGLAVLDYFEKHKVMETWRKWAHTFKRNFAKSSSLCPL